MLEEMLAESPRDSTKEYNLLLNACAKARKWEKAQKLFEVRAVARTLSGMCRVRWSQCQVRRGSVPNDGSGLFGAMLLVPAVCDVAADAVGDSRGTGLEKDNARITVISAHEDGPLKPHGPGDAVVLGA